MMQIQVVQQKDEDPPMWFTVIMCPIICAFLLLGIGLSTVIPILAWISSMANQIFNSVKAQEISKVPNSPCEGFDKIDWVWPCVLGIAIVGTVSVVLNCCLCCCAGVAAARSESTVVQYHDNDDGAAAKLKKCCGLPICCASIASFVLFAMIFDVWLTTPELCKDAMKESFNDGIPLWTMVEVLSVCFIISLAMIGCCCCCGCLVACCGAGMMAALGKEMDEEQMKRSNTEEFMKSLPIFLRQLSFK